MYVPTLALQFLELRDTGVPDTGPKRPKDSRVVALTPAAVETVGDERKRRRSSRGRGRRRESRGGRVSMTPRSRLREDIRDLINSELYM